MPTDPETISGAGLRTVSTRTPEINLTDLPELSDVDGDHPTRKKYREMDPSKIDEEALQMALGIIENDRIQNRVIPLANGLINIPWVPDSWEAWGFNRVYDAVQRGLTYVLEGLATGQDVIGGLVDRIR